MTWINDVNLKGVMVRSAIGNSQVHIMILRGNLGHNLFMMHCFVLCTVPGVVVEGDIRIKSKGWSEVKTKFPGVVGWKALNQGQKQQSH